MEVISREPDGGATLRPSRRELVGYYNLLNTFLQPSTPQELEWAETSGQIKNVQILAGLVGMPHPTYGG